MSDDIVKTLLDTLSDEQKSQLVQSLLKTNEQKETTISKGPFKGSIITIASLPKKHRISVFVHILGKKRRITASLDDINA